MIDYKKLTKEFLNLVQIDSVSGEEERLALILKKDLEGLGFEVTIDSIGNLIGKLKGNRVDAPTLLFCAHLDTVEPGRGIKPIINDNVIQSSGETILGADDKAGIIAIMEALKILKGQNVDHGNLEILFTVMEEVGLKGAQNLKEGTLNAKLGYVLDSDGAVGTIVTKGPFHFKVKIYVKGKAAHAGVNPEEGINAIEVASKALAKLKLGRIDEETTVNIGIISGGKAINIIPDSIYLEGEVRSLTEKKMYNELDQMESIFQEEAVKLGATVDIQVEKLYPGMELGVEESVVLLAKKAIKAIGLSHQIASTGGGSDATILNNKGIPTVNLGVGFKKPHSIEESIRIEDLINSTNLVFNLIKEAANFDQ